MKEYGNLIKFLFADIFLGVIKDNKIPVAIVSLLLVAVIVVGCVALPSDSSSDPVSSGGVSSELSSTGTSSIVSVSSDAPASSSVSSSKPVSSSERPTVSTYAQPEPNIFPPKNSNITPATVKTYTSWNKNGTVFDYKTPMDMEDNVFMDSLIYTGYDVAKQREDNLMWQYILSANKKRIGTSGPYNWLSKISYDYDGRTSGYETNAQGMPDKDFFVKNDLVCASFIGYVYQNYLPNAVGIDTSKLGKPEDFGWSNVLADSWYNVAKTWVQKGWSEFIEFDCRTVSGTGGLLRITPAKSIPIGSIIVTANDSNAKSDYAGHVSIYAGWKDGYNWVYHVGNDNGPEFCSIERMGYNPDPHYRQWLIAIITPPSIVNLAPEIKVTVKDANGKLINGAEVTINRTSNGKDISIGKTNANGVASKDYLYYGDYTITCTADGYEKISGEKIKLTANNNSVNTFTITMVSK